MQIYISVDMEGCAGVVNVDQCRRGGSDYPQARRWMTNEANAAALGAFDAGAERVVINDSHGDMANLLLDDLDRRVEVISGSLKARSMVAGVDQRFDLALFVGYHAGAGSLHGVLDHTYYGRVVANVRVNGKVLSETGLNALVAGVYGTPVGLVTGDTTTCVQAREQLGTVETLAVKSALSRYCAETIMPAVACERIREAAAKVCGNPAPYRPFTMEPPLLLELTTHNAAMADAAVMLPGSERVAGTWVRYEARDPETLLQALRAMTVLGASTIPS